MADNSAEIAKLEAILNAGATSVSIEGETVNYDFAEIRRQIGDLKRTDTNEKKKRSTLSRIRLG